MDGGEWEKLHVKYLSTICQLIPSVILQLFEGFLGVLPSDLLFMQIVIQDYCNNEDGDLQPSYHEFSYFGKEDHCIGSRCKSFVWSIAILERRITVSVTQVDLGSVLASKMEVFVTYSHYNESFSGTPQTSKTELYKNNC